MACMCYQLARKQTINFPNSGKFMVRTREAYGLCVYSNISSFCLPYVPALKLACVRSLACVTAVAMKRAGWAQIQILNRR